MDPQEITNKIKEKVYRIASKRKTRSKAWEIFGEIITDTHEIIANFVACRSCFTVLRHYGNTTTNLIQHSCVQETLPSSSRKIKIEKFDQKLVLNKCTNFCIQDLRPFSIVNGNGFQELIETCIKMGAKYGEHIDVKSMLPDPTTISNSLDDLMKRVKELITHELADSLKLAVTTDLWSDDYKRKSYVSVTAHFIKNDVLREIVLAMREMLGPATAENLHEILTDVLNEYNLTDLHNITFVTDRGSNIVKALESYERYNCMDHLYNNVLVTASSKITEVASFFNACKKLVVFFKKSNNLLSKLKTTLKSECSTRWNSKFEMCDSIIKNINDITLILQSKNKTHLINGINTHLLNEMVEFLRPFKSFSIQLQATQKPTLYLVLPFYNSLKKNCLTQNTDSNILKKFKITINRLFEEIIEPNIKIIHKTATFLYPICKDMKLLGQSEKNDIYLYIKNNVSSGEIEVEASDSGTLSSVFDDFYNNANDSGSGQISNSVDAEITKYLNMPIPNTDIDMLDWWAEHKTSFKHLYKLSNIINCIPATSAASERVFSSGGNIITVKRNRLNSNKVDNLVVINSFYKTCGNFQQ